MSRRPSVGLTLAICLAIQFIGALAAAENYPARVSRVSAGDIYEIDRKGTAELVVLYGVQVGPSALAAKQAREFATQKVLNQHVTVRVVERRPGMTLVEFTLADGSNLGHLMLRKGLVRWDSFTARDDQGLKDLEALAKQEGLGMWHGLASSAAAPGAAPRTGGQDERLYDRRINANYDILEGRSWIDEKGVRTIVLRGNGAKLEGFEGEVELEAAAANQAVLDELALIAEQEAAARAEAERLAYEEQLRAEQAAAQQTQADAVWALNQQLMYGGYVRPSLRVTPAPAY